MRENSPHCKFVGIAKRFCFCYNIDHPPIQAMAFSFFNKLRDKREHLKLIREELDKVRAVIARQVEPFGPSVRPYLEHVCRGRGKLIRPGLVLLTAAATGGITERHLTFAAMLEMLHMASLVHDDVLDKADTRRDEPTPNALWGNELAVLLGDSLLAQAMVMGSELGDLRFIRRLALATRDLCEGEVEQSTRLWDMEMSRADYYELIRKKTATLFSMAMCGAAMLQEMDDEMVDHLERMGTLLGIAYQIYDDCLDLTGSEDVAGKTLGTDAAKGKLTLPVFFLMESSRDDVANYVRRCVEHREEIDFSNLRGTDAFHEAIRLSADEGRARTAEAREVLWMLPESDGRTALTEMTYRLDELLDECCN